MDPVPGGNLLRNNIAAGNFFDLSESNQDTDSDEPYLDPGDTCQNAWMNNHFDTCLALDECLGEAVVLDAEDVRALDDD